MLRTAHGSPCRVPWNSALRTTAPLPLCYCPPCPSACSHAGLSVPPAQQACSILSLFRGGSGGSSSDQEGTSSKPGGWETSISSKFPRDAMREAAGVLENSRGKVWSNFRTNSPSPKSARVKFLMRSRQVTFNSVSSPGLEFSLALTTSPALLWAPFVAFGSSRDLHCNSLTWSCTVSPANWNVRSKAQSSLSSQELNRLFWIEVIENENENEI